MTATATSADAPEATRSRQRSRVGLLLRRLPWWAEAVIAVTFYELYDAVQALTSGDVSDALAHGRGLERVEQHLHVWVEPSVNRFATAHLDLALVGGYYYELAHVTVTVAVLAFLWRSRPAAYAVLRNALLALSLLALAAFWLWPAAPPRYAVSGLSDTLVRNDILGAAHVHSGLVNLYAAMPSLHVAWATWCAAAVVMTSTARRRHLAWAYPLLTTVAVVATANHYLLDAVAGAMLTAATLAVAARCSAVLRTTPELPAIKNSTGSGDRPMG